MASLDPKTLLFETKNLTVPPLDELQVILTEGLRSNFKSVLVEVVDCPDLSKAPFFLASEGICGNPTLMEIGGPPNLLPLVNRNKIYDLKTICRKALGENDDILILGAGAGPFPYLGINVEVSFKKKSYLFLV